MSLPTSIHPFLITGNDANQYKVATSLRFRSSNSAYLSRTQDAATNGLIWTWSAWVKRGSLGSNQVLFCAGAPSNTQGVQFIATDVIQIFRYTGTYTVQLDTTQVFRDPSSWYHLVVANDGTQATASNRIKFYVNGTQVTSFTTATYPAQNTQYEINNNGQAATISRYSAAASSLFDGYLAEVNFIDGQALTPSSFGYTDNLTNQWLPKKYTGTYGTNGFYLPFSNTTSTTQNLLPYSEQFNQASYWGGSNISYTSNSVAAPNGVTAADTCAATATGTAYGTALTNITFSAGQTYTYSMYAKAGTASCFGLNIQPSYSDRISAQYNLSTGTFIGGIVPGGTTSTFVTGGMQFVGNEWYRCWLTATTAAGTGLVYFGPLNTITTPSTDPFNNTIGNSVYVWGAQLQAGAVPGPYTLTTTSAVSTAELSIGADNSNGSSSWNNWRSSGISVTSGTTYDSMRDSPTGYDDGGNGRGNYCIMNPLSVTSVACTFSEANLKVVTGLTGGNAYGSIAIPSSGKWYWEILAASGGGSGWMIGICVYLATQTYAWSNGNSVFYFNNGQKYVDGTGTAYAATYTSNDLIGVAVDADLGTITFYKNNVSQGSITHAVAGLFPCLADGASAATDTFFANFGQRPFSYTPPAGFKALNTYNLANPSLPLV